MELADILDRTSVFIGRRQNSDGPLSAFVVCNASSLHDESRNVTAITFEGEDDFDETVTKTLISKLSRRLNDLSKANLLEYQEPLEFNVYCLEDGLVERYLADTNTTPQFESFLTAGSKQWVKMQDLLLSSNRAKNTLGDTSVDPKEHARADYLKRWLDNATEKAAKSQLQVAIFPPDKYRATLDREYFKSQKIRGSSSDKMVLQGNMIIVSEDIELSEGEGE